MADIRKGDKVRVVLEAEVKYVDTHGNFDLAGGSTIWKSTSVVSIEVLERKPQVGDILDNDVKTEDFPVGTLIHYEDDPGGSVIRKNSAGEWCFAGGGEAYEYRHCVHGTRRLIHIGGGG